MSTKKKKLNSSPSSQKQTRNKVSNESEPQDASHLDIRESSPAHSVTEPSKPHVLPPDQDRPNGIPAETLDRTKVVELAATLASAQIAATANLSIARQLTSTIKSIAGEYLLASGRLKTDLETLGKTPELIDAAFVTQAHSHLMQSADATISTPLALLPLDHCGLNDLFAGAMARAQQLLRSPLLDSQTIYAEQLFNPDEVLTENKIGDRFKQCQWPNLRNRESYHKFMVNVEKWFVSHFDEITSGSDDQFGDDSELLAAILKRRGEDDLFKKIVKLVRTHTPSLPDTKSFQGSFEHLADAAWRRSLIQVIFHDRLPELRPEKRRIRHYRPWGLFRYLRHWGNADGEQADEIFSMLSASRKDLQSDLSPHPLMRQADQRYDFGPLDILASRQLD